MRNDNEGHEPEPHEALCVIVGLFFVFTQSHKIVEHNFLVGNSDSYLSNFLVLTTKRGKLEIRLHEKDIFLHLRRESQRGREGGRGKEREKGQVDNWRERERERERETTITI